MGDNKFDVAVVGAGPAGATAAILLVNKGYSVALIDRAGFPRKGHRTGWLSGLIAPMLEELDLPAKSFTKQTFTDITFHHADFSRSAKPAFEGIPAYLIDRIEFANALVAAAGKRKVQVMQGTGVADVKLMESSVRVVLQDGDPIEARMLMLASGRASDLQERVGVPRGEYGVPLWTAQVDAKLDLKRSVTEPRVGVVLGLDGRSSFGLCCLTSDSVSVGVNWFGEPSKTIPTFVHLCRQAYEHNIVPVDLSEEAFKASVSASPSSAALDMDTHIGKHTLVIGDAGGFVSAASNEGIYPAMWSARIAADVIDKALQSVHSQDELMTFNAAWRMEMAEYLRSPHTDIQFLLPLIFTNQPMADRMGKAFFLGENI